MVKNSEVRYAASPREVKRMDTKELRDEFLIENVMSVNEINWVYSHYDRFMTAGVVPEKPVTLETVDQLKSDFFLERREMGIINIGGKGSVTVDGTVFEIDNKEALYLGCLLYTSDAADD